MEAVTTLVATAKVAVVCPCAIVTVAGTVATPVLALVSVTTMPPAGAARLRVTVPVEALPPMTGLGLTEMPDSCSVPATTSKAAEAVLP